MGRNSLKINAFGSEGVPRHPDDVLNKFDRAIHSGHYKTALNIAIQMRHPELKELAKSRLSTLRRKG